MGSVFMAGATPVKYIGKCIPCNRPVAENLPEHLQKPGFSINSTKNIPCPDCKIVIEAELMYGVVNKMICDDRCMGAYGKQCVCGCGGVNHGDVWTEVIENVPSSVIDAYRKDQERRQQAAQKKRDKAEAKNVSEFTSWAVANADDLLMVRGYTADNPFILEAQAKVDKQVILSPNYLKAVVRVINEDMEKRAREAAKWEAALKSQHVGVVGEKFNFKLTITDIIHIKDNFAFVPSGQEIPTKPLYKFTDEAGNVYCWFASKYQVKLRPDGTFTINDVWKVGDTFVVSALVKKHDEYKDVKQTIISYVKVV